MPKIPVTPETIVNGAGLVNAVHDLFGMLANPDASLRERATVIANLLAGSGYQLTVNPRNGEGAISPSGYRDIGYGSMDRVSLATNGEHTTVDFGARIGLRYDSLKDDEEILLDGVEMARVAGGAGIWHTNNDSLTVSSADIPAML